MKKLLFTLGIMLIAIGFLKAQTTLFSENFEHDGSMPTGWTQDESIGCTNWVAGTGSIYDSTTNPYAGEKMGFAAYQGNYMAYFFFNGAVQSPCNASEGVTKLISPPINLSSVTSAKLNFYYNAYNFWGLYDSLAVYYKTSANGTWTRANFTSIESTPGVAFCPWNSASLTIPGGSSTFYIAFEGYAHWDEGVGVDNITITSTATGISNISQLEYNLNFYPNPVHDVSVLSIPAELKDEDLSLVLYNVMGQEIIKKEIQPGQASQIEINKNNLPTGLYLYQLKNNTKVLAHGKVIMQ